MLLSALDAKHDSYDVDCWTDNEALYRGGSYFRARLGRFLPQNPQEPQQVYSLRQREACYKPYVGSIVDYYVAWLFSASFDVRAKSLETGEPVAQIDEFYSSWKEDVGDDCDINEFLREGLRRALTQGAAHWIVEFPSDEGRPPLDKAEKASRKLGDAKLRRIEREQVYDWECDDSGALLWIITHDLKHIRPDPRRGERDTFVETWKLYDPDMVETFQVAYEKGKRPQPTEDIASIGIARHGAKQVPLVTMSVPDGLWLVERTKEAQLENFRMSAALAWNIKRTCYAMPVFHVQDATKPPVMGTGYYIMLGVDEKCEWIGPPTEHLAITAHAVDTGREEIYRITHQLALSVNNSKAAAVARSGESKEQDSLSTRVMLNALGAVVREALEETYEVLSDGRGDTEISFSVEGLDAFDTDSVSVLLANVNALSMLAIPSVTLTKEVKTRAGLAMAPDADQAVKDQIRQEIADGVDQDTELEDALKQARADAELNPPDGNASTNAAGTGGPGTSPPGSGKAAPPRGGSGARPAQGARN